MIQYRKFVLALGLMVLSSQWVYGEIYPGLNFRLKDYSELEGLTITRDKIDFRSLHEVDRVLQLEGDGNAIFMEIVVGATPEDGMSQLQGQMLNTGFPPVVDTALGTEGYADISAALFCRGNVFVRIFNSWTGSDLQDRVSIQLLAHSIDETIRKGGPIEPHQLEAIRPKLEPVAKMTLWGGGPRSKIELVSKSPQSKLLVFGDSVRSKHLAFDHEESGLWLKVAPEIGAKGVLATGVKTTKAIINVVNDQLLAGEIEVPVEADLTYRDTPGEHNEKRPRKPPTPSVEVVKGLVEKVNRGELTREQMRDEIWRLQRESSGRPSQIIPESD